MVKNTMFKSNSFSRINKFVLVTLLFIVMVGFVSSADVAYVVKDEARVQKNIIDSFSEMGLTYEVVEDSQINSKTNFAQYEVILIDDHLFNLRNTVKYIDISKYKTIITNPYEGEEYGLTDKDGISSLTSNNPLSVVKGNSIIQVYNSAYDVRRRAISYYYLGKYNKAEGFMSIATPYKGGSEVLGDVISIAMPGVRLSTGKITQEKICFFGISESKYWTPAAKKLFKDECLGFVAFEIECYQDSDCNDNDDYTKDVCNNPGEYTSYCENIQIECLSDNDCGVDGFIGGEFCTEAGDVGKEYRDYSCLNAGTTSSSCVFDDEIKVVEQCSELCSEGQCVSVTCNENIDCGVDGFVGSEMCTISGDVGKEYISYLCNNPGTLQSSCSNETELRTIEECSEFCADGQCGNYVCNENSDCDDNNARTMDECINPGTHSSFCRNTEINCASDIDCGTNGFIGNEYCSLDDVKKNYQSATCVNNGTTESYCIVNVEDKTIQECEYACNEGSIASCVRCDENLDCNDDNSNTNDRCVNPGEIGSYCVNEDEDIECSYESDCGVDGFIGSEYCSENGDSVRDYKDYSCNNAGTPESYCSSGIETRLIEECSELCSEGQCVSVTCNENIDCGVDGFIGSEMCTISGDVGKEYISYLCNNPGTLQSSCSNETELRTIEECSYGCVGGVCEQPPIECSTNLDCGEVSYEGNYCSQKDVIREVTTPTCKQAGTSESYCEDVISYETIEQCSQECSNGVCVDNRIHDISVLDIIFERNGIGVGNILVRNKDYNMTSVLLNLGGFDESVELINNVSSNNQLFKSGQETVGITVSETKDVKSLFKTDIQNGYYDVSVLGKIENDNNLNDNLVVEEILVTECINNNDCSVGYLCKNGGTINAKCEQQIIQCRNDAECDDGSDYTVDRCVNPGTTSSFCRHTEVNCVYNTDCGETGFVGGEYCSEDGVYKNYQTAICKYPATLDSHCQVSVDQISINQCEYACSEDGSIASCIRCDENLDCNDGNDNTIDRCVNPGSVESYCKNELDLGNVVNIIDSDVSGDACGVVKVSCKTDLPTDYIQLYYDVNAIDSRFVKKEIKEEYTYYEWEILVNAPLMEEKTYEIGCLLNVSIPGNDLSPIRPYPGDAIGEGSLQGKICSNIPPVCGFDEHAEFILSTTIEPTNEEYVIPQQIDDPTLDIINVISQGKVSNLVNGFNLNEGDYIAQITDGAISRWSNDSQDTTSWGGGEGLTWEGVANVAYQDGNNVNNIRFGSIWKSLPSEARDSARGKYVRFDHTGGEIYVYMDDSYIEDNRGSLEVSIYECVEN